MFEGQLQASELIVFLIGLAGLAIVSLEVKPTKKVTSFFLGYAALFLGTLFTVTEGFLFFSELNILEHAVGLSLAGIFFALCAYRAHTYLMRVEKKLGEKKWITS